MFTAAPFVWAASHLPAIGWTALVVGIYRGVIFLFRAGQTMAIVQQRVLKGEETIHLIATNHLSHLQASVDTTNDKVDETNRILGSIKDSLQLSLEERYQSFRRHADANKAELQSLREYVMQGEKSA